jgi:endonuclease/exonuclease/phosphatase family metal-dependent hydrolase
MRLSACVFLLVCGCGDSPKVTTAPPTITAINYNMYFGIAENLIPENTTTGALSATANALINAVALTDYTCRIDGAARLIAAEHPDVIGLQEAISIAYARDLDDRGEDDVIVDFVESMVDALERENGVRYRAFIRENTVIQSSLPLFGGIRLIDRTAILVHPKFSTAKLAGDLTFHTLEPASDFAMTATGEVVRGALHVQVPFTSGALDAVQVPFTPGALDLYSTHLQSGADQDVRVAQAQELAAFIRDTSRPDSTIILTGDLNDIPGSPTYQAIAAELVDTYAVAGVLPGYTAYQTQTLTDPTDRATQRIDYVFVRAEGVDHSRVIVNQVVGPCNLWPSDHFGVSSQIRTVATPPPTQ